MFVHIAIHSPKPEKARDLADSMRRVRAAAGGLPGLIDVAALRDVRSGRLVGLARWESREHFEAAKPAMFAVVENDPFDEWEDNPPDVFHLEVLD